MFPQPIDFSMYNESYIDGVREQSKEKNSQVGSVIGAGIGAVAGAFLGSPTLGASIGGGLGGLVGGQFENKRDVREAEGLVGNAQAQIQANTATSLDESISQGMEFGYNQRTANMRNKQMRTDYLKFLK